MNVSISMRPRPGFVPEITDQVCRRNMRPARCSFGGHPQCQWRLSAQASQFCRLFGVVGNTVLGSVTSSAEFHARPRTEQPR